ncbi:porin [Moritella sp. F3]|uniref:porin n=1 Tax=Moritella sp. F3 TaxID=2718882 RepID=UPI0018E10531|nr:porin [Moritella sp. F3]GIC75813.1 membrane protein [Moritella sp. F1]GIC81738.1 membrane protein [Moritella sp. F3]
MKKTILASAILLAGAANAAEVYSNDDTTISLGGSFRGNVVVNSSDDVKFQDAGSRFDIKAVKDIEDGLKAFGHLEVKYSGSTGDTLYMQKAIVGLEHDVYGTATLGKQMGLNDDLVMNDFSYENGVYNEDNALFGSDSEDQLKYAKSFGGASVVVSLMDQDTYAIGGTYEVAGLTVGGSYNIANDRTVNAVVVDNSTYIVGAQYSLDALTLGVQYQSSEVGSEDFSAYGLGAHYQLGQAGVYAMYDVLDGKFDDSVLKGDGSIIVLGADYELVKDVKAYVEFDSSDFDVDGSASSDSDEKVTIGARVYF